VNFDVKAKLEERERKSQMVAVGFSMVLSTKPSIVKFEVEGVATLMGKEAEITKILEVDPENKVPFVFQRVYQHVFMAMYLLSTILNAPPPPHDLLFPHREGVPVEDVSMEAEATEAREGITLQTTAEIETEEEEETRKVSISNK